MTKDVENVFFYNLVIESYAIRPICLKVFGKIDFVAIFQRLP